MQDICFTWFEYDANTNLLGYTQRTIDKLREELDILYIVMGYEICPTTKRKHLQGYLELLKKHNTQWRKRHLYGLMCASRRGIQESAITYCKKGLQSHLEWEAYGIAGDNYGRGARVIEWGKPTEDEERQEGKKQGKRSDLNNAVKKIKLHKTKTEMWSEDDYIDLTKTNDNIKPINSKVAPFSIDKSWIDNSN